MAASSVKASVDDESCLLLFACHPPEQHARLLQSAQHLQVIRNALDIAKIKLGSCKRTNIRQKQRTHFRDTIQKAVKQEPNYQAILTVISGEPCKQCVDLTILTCFALAEKHIKNIESFARGPSLGQLLREAITFEFSNTDTRDFFVGIIEEVCQEHGKSDETNNLRAFLNAKTSQSHHRGDRISSRPEKHHRHDVDSSEETAAHSAKRQRCTSPAHGNTAVRTPLILDAHMLQDLRGAEIPESSLMCNPRSNATSFESPRAGQLLRAYEAIGTAVELSNQWRYERKREDERTNCLTALISDTEEEDVSFVFRLGRVPAFKIIKFLDFASVGTVSSAKNPDK